jgi:hypothetical protein
MHMNMKLVAVVCILPVLAACSYFSGESEREPVAADIPVGHLTSDCGRLQPLFGASDKELTKEKFEAALKVEMAKWDKDGSGDLTNSEVEPLNDALRAENVGASPVTDWNGDGRVDFQEFASGWRTMFELCDRNHNKIVSLGELGYSPNVTAPREAEKPKEPPAGSSTQQDRPTGRSY